MPPLTTDEVDRYLDRIGADLPRVADVACLARLQLAHLRTVPFENLDIHRDVPIELDHGRIADKVVGRRRGGYCYELNSLFGRLLVTLGYGVDMVSARVVADGADEGPEFEHLALLVDVDGAGRHLVDVGFGDAFEVPIPLVDGAAHAERTKRVRVVAQGERWCYQEDRGEGWSGQYTFAAVPRSLDEFSERNRWQQTAPESHFRSQPMCTLLTPDGRVTLAGTRLIETTPAGRTELEIDADRIAAVRRERFGITLD